MKNYSALVRSPDADNGTGEAAAKSEPVMTFGQKAVGLSFNPSGDRVVTDVKQRFADLIDIANSARVDKSTTPGAQRHFSVAITQLEDAQMRFVKALTFRD